MRTFYKIAGFILLCCLFKYCAKRFQAPVYYNLIYHLANLFPVRNKVENVCKFANLLALSTLRISKLQKIVFKCGQIFWRVCTVLAWQQWHRSKIVCYHSWGPVNWNPGIIRSVVHEAVLGSKPTFKIEITSVAEPETIGNGFFLVELDSKFEGSSDGFGSGSGSTQKHFFKRRIQST